MTMTVKLFLLLHLKEEIVWVAALAALFSASKNTTKPMNEWPRNLVDNFVHCLIFAAK